MSDDAYFAKGQPKIDLPRLDARKLRITLYKVIGPEGPQPVGAFVDMDTAATVIDVLANESLYNWIVASPAGQTRTARSRRVVRCPKCDARHTWVDTRILQHGDKPGEVWCNCGCVYDRGDVFNPPPLALQGRQLAEREPNPIQP